MFSNVASLVIVCPFTETIWSPTFSPASCAAFCV